MTKWAIHFVIKQMFSPLLGPSETVSRTPLPRFFDINTWFSDSQAIITVVGALMTDMLYPYWKVPPIHAAHAANRSVLLGNCSKTETQMSQTKHWKGFLQTFFSSPHTFFRRVSFFSLTSRGWYSSINSLGILSPKFCSVVRRDCFIQSSERQESSI